MEDLDALSEIAQFLDAHTDAGRLYEFSGLIEQFCKKSSGGTRTTGRKRKNLKTLGDKMRGFERLVVPQPIDSYTTSRVLTMEYISGAKITKLNPLVRLDLDGPALAEQLF